MLAGRRPFAAEDPRALAAQHVYEEVPGMGEGVPGGLARIVRRLLAKRVEERFGGAGEVVRALAGVGVS